MRTKGQGVQRNLTSFVHLNPSPSPELVAPHTNIYCFLNHRLSKSDVLTTWANEWIVYQNARVPRKGENEDFKRFFDNAQKMKEINRSERVSFLGFVENGRGRYP